MAYSVSPEIPPERQPYELTAAATGCLILHGFMGSPYSSRPLGDYLHAAGFTVHCPLLPGHGHLPARLHGASHRQWLTTAEDALARLRPRCDAIVLVGHSMGAILGAHLATRNPDIRAFAMIAPLYDVPSRVFHLLPVLRRLLPWLQPLKLPQVDNAIVFQRLRDFDPAIDLDDPDVQAWLPEGTRLPTSALDEMRRMTRIGRRLWPRLALPTLILQGGHDPAAPPSFGASVHAAVPHRDKQYHFFPEAGHELMRPFDPAHEQVWPLIRDFLLHHARA